MKNNKNNIIRVRRKRRTEVFTLIGRPRTEREIRIAICRPGVTRSAVLAALSDWEPPIDMRHAAFLREQECKAILLEAGLLADTLGQRIVVKRGLKTQVACAADSGHNERHWQAYEQGRKCPELVTLIRLAASGGVTVGYLLRGIESEI